MAPHEYIDLAPLFAERAALDPTDPRREVLRERLITGHLPLAEHIARRFSHRGLPQDDLVQVATVGLINAVDRFSPERGIDFLSFALPTIMGEIRRHFRDTAWSVRVPRRLKELYLAIAAANAELGQQLGRAPTPSEIATHLGRSREEIFEGLEAGQVYHSASLDEPAPEGSSALLAALGDEDPRLAGVDRNETLRPLIERLPERERRILAMRFFGNLTQTEIAAQVGISQMHVSRLLTRTLATLRAGMGD